MKKVEFLRQFRELLEVESTVAFKESTNIKDLEGYDSYKTMTIIAFIDEKFSTKLSASQLSSITTVKSLMELIGNENFTE